MTTTLREDQAAHKLGVAPNTLSIWRRIGFVPSLGCQYPADYIKRLAQANGVQPVKRQFALFFYLCEQYSNTPITAAHGNLHSQGLALIRLNHVMPTRIAAKQLGYGEGSLRGWHRNGYLSGFLLLQGGEGRADGFRGNQKRYFLTSEIDRLKQMLHEGISSHEAATILGISLSAVTLWRQTGRLASLAAPGRIVRFDPAEVERLRQHLEQLAPQPQVITVAAAAERLGVNVGTIHKWDKLGITNLGLTVARGVAYCKETEIASLEQTFNSLQPAFGWLQAMFSMTGKPPKTYNRSKTARYLGAGSEGRAIRRWCSDDLLPYFNRTPPGAAYQRVTEFPCLYLFGLKRFLNNRTAARPLIAEYRDLCTSAEQIV